MAKNKDALVEQIVLQVSEETGVQIDLICSRDKRYEVLHARRAAMRRARNAGLSNSAIARVLGIASQAISRALDRNEERDEAAAAGRAAALPLLAPFRRPGGRVSALTAEDYGLRAKATEEEVQAALKRLLDLGLIVRAPLPKVSNLMIYDLSEAAREALQ